MTNTNDEYSNEKTAAKVVYEFNMFNFLYERLRSEFMETATFLPGDITYLGTGRPMKCEDRLTFAILESFLLHTRVLHDFFFKSRNSNDPKKNDDSVASDFVPDWSSVRPQKGEYLGNKDRFERLNKALAHLTIRRVEYDQLQKAWNVDAIKDEVGNLIEAFQLNLPPERKAWFDAVE